MIGERAGDEMGGDNLSPDCHISSMGVSPLPEHPSAPGRAHGTLRRVSGWLHAGAVLLAVFWGGTSQACVGTACMQIWSTADGGGALAVQWDFTQEVQTGPVLCVGTTCFYSTIDPGFMAPPDDVPGDAFYRLPDGTDVSLEIVTIDPVLSIGNVNGHTLKKAGDSASLGTMPTIHVHPSWQIKVASDVFATYQLSYKLTTTSLSFTESQVYTVNVTNVAPVEPTPTPSPMPVSDCAADCDANHVVDDAELDTCTEIALLRLDASTCAACDANGDDTVTVDDIIAGVAAKITACPTPLPVTFEEIQATIFTPRCAVPTCHDSTSAVENLVLESSVSYDQMVGVQALESPLLRVKAGDPDASFLYIKVAGPPPLGQGTQMPQSGGLLTAAEIQMIRDWITQGAPPP
jgi:hypothetical protein